MLAFSRALEKDGAGRKSFMANLAGPDRSELWTMRVIVMEECKG